MSHTFVQKIGYSYVEEMQYVHLEKMGHSLVKEACYTHVEELHKGYALVEEIGYTLAE